MSIMQGSTESGDLNPQQFKQSQPIMLQKKHQTAMNQVKELQELEKYLFKNLQNVNKSDQDSQAQEAAIRTRINELKTMRMNLFDKLKHLYTDAQDSVNINRRDLADQIAVSKTMEDELENTEDTLRQLEAEKNSKAVRLPLANLNMPHGSIVALVNHNGHLTIPAGDFQVLPNDTVLIFCIHSKVNAENVAQDDLTKQKENCKIQKPML